MTRKDSLERLRRLLDLIPWVVAHDSDGGPTVEATCRRFAISQLELETDLELLFVCGLHPYTPDMLMEADLVDGRVRIRYADYLAAPARLSSSEGLALLASARSLLDTPGTDPNGPLARGLAKLAATVGAPTDAVRVDAPLADTATLDALRTAARDRLQVAMDYYAFGRDERRVRIVEPGGVFTTAGQWYLSAFCTEVAQNRVFRVDRIVELTVSDRPATGPAAPAAPSLFQDTALGQARIVLDRDATWVASQYPVHAVVARDNGRLEVTLPVQAYAWLDRLLMRLGPHAELVEAPPGYPGVRAAASAIARRHG